MNEFTFSFFPNCHYDHTRLYLLDNCRMTKKFNEKCNLEAMEFIGDRFIQSKMARYLYLKYNLMDNGMAQEIGSRCTIMFLDTKHLANLCTKIGLDQFILMAPNEGTPYIQIKEDVVESWIGSCTFIFSELDCEKLMFRLFDLMDFNFDFFSLYDYKTVLNSLMSCLKIFVLKDETYNKHEEYACRLWIESPNLKYFSCIGYGKYKKEAELDATKKMVLYLKKEHSKIFDQVPIYKKWLDFKDSINA